MLGGIGGRRLLAGTARTGVESSGALALRATAGRHSHPGDEIGYVLEGEADLVIDGEDPRRIRAGESYIIPAGTVHDAVNAGAGTLKLVGVFVVDKGKPLAVAAK